MGSGRPSPNFPVAERTALSCEGLCGSGQLLFASPRLSRKAASSDRAAAVGVRVPAVTSCSTAVRRRAMVGAVRKCSRRPSPISDHSAARACSARRRDQAPVCSSAAWKRSTSSHTSRIPSSFECRDRAHRDLPFRQRRPDQPQGARVVRSRAVCRGGELAIRLVDEHEIGELDHAALDPLQFVAGRRRQDQHEHVDDLGDRGLGLADPDRLDQYRVEPGCFAEQDRLAGAARHTARSIAGRGGPDEGRGSLRQFGHAGLVAEDRTACAL